MNDNERGNVIAPMFAVLVNDEGQYGILPDFVAAPDGWVMTGFSGTQDECIAHVDAVWMDMRPNSLQVALGSEVSA